MENTLIKSIEASLKTNWDSPALSDYKGSTYYYKDVARRIAKLHILFEECGIKKGDKISVCGRNSANWGTVFLASLTYGAVVVPILHEFKPDNVHNIVNHSESTLLFVGDMVWEGLNEAAMPDLEAIVLINDFTVLHCKDPKVARVRERLNEYFGKKYPKNFRPEHIEYFEEDLGDLALINYTSGPTGFSKGVMLTYGNLFSNQQFALQELPEMAEGGNVVAMLPMAHMYGLAFEFMYEVLTGCHVHFLTRVPSPKIILEALAEIKPRLIVTVPLVIEKIYRSRIKPMIDKPLIKAMLSLPVLDKKVLGEVLAKLNEVFGNNFLQIIVGGAAFNQEVERFFKKMGFRFTVGYGMTECAPIISFEHWDKMPLYSCGHAALGMEIRIDSPDPENVVGEIQVRGKNVMLGYYKNPEATAEVFTADGWMKTGDLGIMDKDGYLYIKGRSKNMILGPSGQNIYPEEIEDKLNNEPTVVESIVVQSGDKLVALLYPDFTLLQEMRKNPEEAMEEVRVAINKDLPNYAQIASVKIYPEEFEKTPKRSIKRFMYKA